MSHPRPGNVAMPCGHCGHPVRHVTRGLCQTCYGNRVIRDQHPSRSPTGIAANGHAPNPLGMACSACGCWMPKPNSSDRVNKKICTTCANPDSRLREELHRRLAVFEQRAAARLPLFDAGERISALLTCAAYLLLAIVAPVAVVVAVVAIDTLIREAV